MNKFLEGGKLPTCATCIYGCVKKSITYCLRKAPTTVGTSGNHFEPTMSKDAFCGEGVWLMVFSGCVNSFSYEEVYTELKYKEYHKQQNKKSRSKND